MNFSRALAEKIVAALFVNGQGQEAERLVLVSAENSDLGGWGRKPAVCQVDRAITDHYAHYPFDLLRAALPLAAYVEDGISPEDGSQASIEALKSFGRGLADLSGETSELTITFKRQKAMP